MTTESAVRDHIKHIGAAQRCSGLDTSEPGQSPRRRSANLATNGRHAGSDVLYFVGPLVNSGEKKNQCVKWNDVTSIVLKRFKVNVLFELWVQRWDLAIGIFTYWVLGILKPPTSFLFHGHQHDQHHQQEENSNKTAAAKMKSPEWPHRA